MKFELEEYHRGITEVELLAELKRIALKLNKAALNRKNEKSQTLKLKTDE